MFTQQAETKIYNAVDFPALRKNSAGNITADNKYLGVPTDFNYPHSLAVVSAAGAYTYLLPKDVNFIREAYPTPTDTGMPQHYSLFDDGCLLLGPTPDTGYVVELHYSYYPESIVTAATTWLGDTFDNALLNGALVEALRFMKGEADLVAMYDKMYQEAVMLLKSLGEGKLRRDSYRDGQPAMAVL